MQHALRAFTPEDQAALAKTVKTYPNTKDYDMEEALTSLGIGEAIVTVLSERGAPTPVAWTRMRSPRSLMAAIGADAVSAAAHGVAAHGKYGTTVDRESAYEKLTAKIAEPAQAPVPEAAPRDEPPPAYEPGRSRAGSARSRGSWRRRWGRPWSGASCARWARSSRRRSPAGSSGRRQARVDVDADRFPPWRPGAGSVATTDPRSGRVALQCTHVLPHRAAAMIRPSPWPELDRLARFVRAADSLTDTLAAWTGRGLVVEIVNRVEGVRPDPLVAESLALHDGALVQDREVRMRCGEVVVAAARSWVAADSRALTPAVRNELRGGAGLGDLLRPVQRRRVPVRVTTLRERPAGDPAAAVLAVAARLDVAGTPVAWCEETIFEAVLADGRSRDRRPLRIAA